ncbi:hypothetical protein BDN72DRAFT_881802 [Pluteus cervinus]|uniref:Uncharacterized protein n=1 Tax=Pluteus cervinus TaxID=181527 RepID=A0ACD3ADX4_9AGAR|nr:hypothetical protein BDN72DRAFT_881802 [Pluteus cervinus]
MSGVRLPSDSPSSFYSAMDLPRAIDQPPAIGPSSSSDAHQQQHEPHQGGSPGSNASSISRPLPVLTVPGAEREHDAPVPGPSFHGTPTTSMASMRPGSEGVENGDRASFPRHRPPTLKGGGGTVNFPNMEFGMDHRMPVPIRTRTIDGHSQIYSPGGTRRSARDLSVPEDVATLARSHYEPPLGTPLKDRLQGTITEAEKYLHIYQRKKMLTGYALNIAIGLQVLFGALTTGLSAALSGKQVSIATAVLGGFSTIVASYLARARGSGEPELSTVRVKDLEQFIRECNTFQTDFGTHTGTDHDYRLTELRDRFEEILNGFNPQRERQQPAAPVAPPIPAKMEQMFHKRHRTLPANPVSPFIL